MKKIDAKIGHMALLLAGTAFLSAPAFAQNGTSAAPQQDDSTLGDIVVTAQKRSERLVDVPIAITAIEGSALASAGVETTQQLTQVVPGLRLDFNGGYSQPTIRGVGSALAGPGINPAVATYVDGYYRPSQLSNNFEFADLESVQVLKGPQGTLFGRNATGGAIVVTTAKPSYTPTAKGTLSFGRFNDLRLTMDASGGLSDNLAAGMAFAYHKTDGFVTNVHDGRDDAGRLSNIMMRGKILYEPTPTISFLLTGEYYRADDYSSTAYNAYNGLSVANGLAYVPSKRGEVNLDQPRRFLVEAKGVTLTSTFDLDFATLTSYTQYRDESDVQSIDIDLSPLPILSFSFPPQEKTFTQELNLASDSKGRFNWAAGLFYYWDNSVYPSYVGNVNGSILNFYDVGVKTKAYAAFADLTYEVVDNLFVTLGGRYSYEKSSQFFAIFPPSPYVRSSANFDGFTPRAVVRYNVSPNTNVYASYSRGFKSGGFSPTSGSIDPFQPEKIDAFELGLKSSSRGFRIEGSAYYYKYDDLQIANYVSGVAFIKNAASSEIYGADLSVTAEVTDRLTLTAGGAYTHARFQNFPNASFYCFFGGPAACNGADGPTASQTIRIVTRDASGKPLPRSPEWTANASISYDQPVGDASLNFAVNGYYSSSFNFDPSGFFRQSDYTLVNAKITYKSPDGYHVGIYGRNLTDTKYIAQVLPLETAIAQQYGTPVSYGVEVGFQF